MHNFTILRYALIRMKKILDINRKKYVTYLWYVHHSLFQSNYPNYLFGLRFVWFRADIGGCSVNEGKNPFYKYVIRSKGLTEDLWWREVIIHG